MATQPRSGGTMPCSDKGSAAPRATPCCYRELPAIIGRELPYVLPKPSDPGRAANASVAIGLGSPQRRRSQENRHCREWPERGWQLLSRRVMKLPFAPHRRAGGPDPSGSSTGLKTAGAWLPDTTIPQAASSALPSWSRSNIGSVFSRNLVSCE